MTALWFLLVAGWVLGGAAVLWRVASVVVEVLREPVPTSIRRDVDRGTTAGPTAGHAAVTPSSVGDTDAGTMLFTRSRAAALASRPGASRPGVPVSRHTTPAPVAPPTTHPEPAPEPTYAPSWGDLLAETLREAESIRG